MEDVVAVLSPLVGSEERAHELLRAHQARGFTPEAYEALGIP
ncbi:hypothetical protein [Arsenicicoccus dermatophilus]|nr:hypothetical protein [Arsenicicoccus dermatophilus]